MAGGDDAGIDREQLLLVAVAVTALVAAAFLLPQAEPQSPQSEQRDVPTPPERPDGGDGDSIQLPPGEGDGGRVVMIDEDREGRDVQVDGERVRARCVLSITPEPRPGASVRVRLIGQEGPISGAVVRFNGEGIGRTGDDGEVVGTVPYREQLRVTASYPGESDCSFDRVIGGGEAAALAAGAGAGLFQQTTPDGSDPAATVTVDGEVQIVTAGTPYPGETIAIGAHIDGVPMRSATVRVDGERVGETDSRGVYESLSIPDDGAETVTVSVSRGDFTGTRTIQIAVLDASLRPAGALVLPWSRSVVVAQRTGDRVPAATVELDGDRIGTTDGAGRLPLRAPTDLDATITVATDRQRAVIDVGDVYVFTAAGIVVYALVAGAVTGLVGRSYGRRQGALVLAGAAGLLALAVVYSYGGRPALLVAVTALALVGLVALVYRGRDTISGGADAAGGFLAWLPGLALGVARRIERLLERIGPALADLLGRVRRAGSVRAALAAVVDWLHALPARLRGGLPGVSRRAVVLTVLALLATGVAFVVARWPGALATVLVFAALALAFGRSEDTEASRETAAAADRAEPESAEAVPSGASEADPATLRERWRAFARWVRPGRWRTSTTGDVERAATDQGYPSRAVQTLAGAFRRLEYARDGVDEETRERADEAFETLSDHREEGERR